MSVDALTARVADQDNALLLADDTGNVYRLVPVGDVLALTKNGSAVAYGGPTRSVDATIPSGYSTGAGGAVTQITNAATGVTLSKPCGQITTVALTTAAGAEEAFVVTNTLVDATDVVVVSTTYAGGGKPVVFVTNVGAGVFTVNISNVHATAALNAVMVINFAVIKAVAA